MSCGVVFYFDYFFSLQEAERRARGILVYQIRRDYWVQSHLDPEGTEGQVWNVYQGEGSPKFEVLHGRLMILLAIHLY